MGQDRNMGRRLDFIVIGAQKAGTTSLWQYLRGHPRIFMPRAKEAPFFIYPGAARGGEFEAYMRRIFAEAPPDALLGKATPDYMLGRGSVGLEAVAERIAADAPAAKLIALLRDPIERAVSNHTMEARRGHERRPLDEALEDQLAPQALAAARACPDFTNSYVIQGEYGRVLEIFRSRFPREQMLVAQSRDLARDPRGVLERVLAFLGLPPGPRPHSLGVRHFAGGSRRRVDAEGEASLLAYLREEVLPHMEGDPALHANAFGFFFETWNVLPDEAPAAPSAEIRLRLERHYREDAERLRPLGAGAPWLAEWEERRNGSVPRADAGAGAHRDSRPIVVGGCYRSGTSLVRRLLDSHPRIHCGPEVKLLMDFHDAYIDAEDPVAHLRFIATARSLLPEDEVLEVLGGALVEMHERAARAAGKARWADKVPENVAFLEEWQRILGDEWIFLHVARNPLDTLASIAEQGFPKSIPAGLGKRIDLYVRCAEAGLAFAAEHPERYVRVLYEDLVEEPEATVRALMESLGERFDPRQLAINSPPHQPGLEDPKAAAASEIHRHGVGGWRRLLSEEEAARIAARTAAVWSSLDPGGRHRDLLDAAVGGAAGR
jgi:hypothetical protein